MDRRDFLRIRRRGQARVVELSCESLYMQLASAGSEPGQDPSHESDWWCEEPPAVIDGTLPEAVFADIERELSGAEVLRIQEVEWLRGGELGRRLGDVVAAFRRGGGRVETVEGAGP